MNPVLKITTKLVKTEFDKGIKDMKKDAAQVTQELNSGSAATEGMASGLAASVGSMVELAVVIGLVVLAVKLITDAVSNLIEGNDELNNKIRAIVEALTNLWEGFVNMFASVLKPALEWIVNAIYTLLGYINAITQAWFGFSIFADNQKKRLKESNKEAKKLKKTLAGFDTANILSDSSTKGGGSKKEEIEPITFPEVEIPSWLQWIIDNKDLVIGIILSIGGTIAAVTGNIPVLLGILGIALATWWEPIKNFIIGLGTWLYNNIIVPVKNLLVKLSPVITPIINFIKKTFETIYGVIKTKVNNIGTAIKNIFTVVKWVYDKVKPWIDKLVGLFNGVWSKLKEIFGSKIAQTIIDTFTGLFKKIFNGLMSKLENMMNAPIKAINGLIGVVKKIPGLGSLEKLSTFNLPRLAQGGIVNNPGRGVVMGNYVAGERGAEAVIPLTDDTLQRLANMIPINIDLTNRLDSRVISRQMVEINKNQSFARNGG